MSFKLKQTSPLGVSYKICLLGWGGFLILFKHFGVGITSEASNESTLGGSVRLTERLT